MNKKKEPKNLSSLIALHLLLLKYLLQYLFSVHVVGLNVVVVVGFSVACIERTRINVTRRKKKDKEKDEMRGRKLDGPD